MAYLPIETERLRLRHFQESDLAAFLAYRNDPEVARYQGWESTTPEQGEEFIAEMRTSEPGTPENWFQFALALKIDDQLIGDIGLRIQDNGRQGMVGYTLTRNAQGQGYMTEALIAVVELAFQQFNLHRIIALVDPLNTASWKLLERIGFRREGHFVEHWWNKGRWVDDYQYAMLQSEWQAKKS